MSIKVLGKSEDNKLVAGELLFGILRGKQKIYFVKTFDDAVIVAKDCRDDKPLLSKEESHA